MLLSVPIAKKHSQEHEPAIDSTILVLKIISTSVSSTFTSLGFIEDQNVLKNLFGGTELAKGNIAHAQFICTMLSYLHGSGLVADEIHRRICSATLQCLILTILNCQWLHLW
jgi:hypothetical protein